MLSRHLKFLPLFVLLFILSSQTAEACSCGAAPTVLDSFNVMFDIDNVVRGHIYDPTGQPMIDVCLHLVPADGTKGAYLGGCSEKDGSFKIERITPGAYVLILNDDGEMTSTEPFGTFYYPKGPILHQARAGSKRILVRGNVFVRR